jgi:hypothetical protein
MKLKALALLLALVTGGPAMAACTQTFNLGVMGPPALRFFGNDFSSTRHFEDCYNFTLSGPTDSLGLAWELDASWTRDIDLDSVTLTGGSLVSALVDTSASSFSFSNLAAGVYQFVVAGDVTGRNGGLFGGGVVGYFGSFETQRATGVAAPVPEPKTYALLALGLLAVGWTVRRRNSV